MKFHEKFTKAFETVGDGIVGGVKTVGDAVVGVGDAVVVKPVEMLGKGLEDLFIGDKTETGSTFGEKMDDTFQKRAKDAQKGARRLRDVFVAPLMDLGETFVPTVHHKSPEEASFINKALADSIVFSHLGEHEKKALIDAFEPHDVKAGTDIIKQGGIGDYYYVLRKGTVRFVVDGTHVGDAEGGNTFGELALLYDCPRAATCTAATDCALYRLDQKTFRRLLANYTIQKDNDTKALLQNVSFLASLDDAYLTKIAQALSTKTYEKGEYLARKGEAIETFFIVKEGTIKGTDIEVGGSKYDDITMGKGECFGQQLVMKGVAAYGNVVALDKVTALCMSKNNFVRLLGNMDDLISKSAERKQLGIIPIGNRPKLDKHDVDALATAMTSKTFMKGTVFFTEGKVSENPTLYLVRSGKVSIQTGTHPILQEILGFELQVGETKYIEEGGYFGNDTLSLDEKGRFGKATYTVTAVEDCTLAVLDWRTIDSVLGKQREAGKIDNKDLDRHRILGAGTFGQVWLVSRKGDKKEAYALKIQFKRQLIEYGQADGVTREKKIMARLDSPFIIRLVNSWQDDASVYMLMKLYQGGELHSVLHTSKRHGVPEWAAKFYAAGILEGLSYMHRRKILYRDLKPENVLLDGDGYTVIVDLGFAKIVKDKTYTFCGTPLYLAPEVILQKGHDKGADHWSWGVMLYEMCVGMTPFYDGEIDQTTLFKRIVHGKYEFPPGFLSLEAEDLITRMLITRPSERLGSFAGADLDIRNHPWFSEVDFNKLVRKELKSPYVPDIKDPLDSSNFDDWSDLEKKGAPSGKPLSAKEQKVFQGF